MVVTAKKYRNCELKANYGETFFPSYVVILYIIHLNFRSKNLRCDHNL